MNKILALIVFSILAGAGAFAQAPPSPGDAGQNVLFYRTGGGPGPVGLAGGSAGVLSIELAGNGKPVAGAPYTATVSTETTQVLGDGNRIVNKTSASLSRDSLGRTRREEAMGMVGPWQVNGPTLVFINDPGSQTNYVLDPSKQTATILKFSPIGAGSPPPGANVTVMQKRIINGQPDEAKTESLGVQSMEGVNVEGKRITRTIPAGQIGNLQLIEVISEVWFSPDLQVVVMSKHNDPRFGETSYQLTGIQRGEPDHSLFEVPPGYTVKNVSAPMPPLPPQTGSGDAPEPFQFGIVGSAGPLGK